MVETQKAQVNLINEEAEADILGAILINEELLPQVADIIQPEDFSKGANKYIFAAMLSLADKDTSIDYHTVSEELRQNNSLELVGGNSYIAELHADTITTANVIDHSKIVKELSIKRQTIEISEKIQEAAKKENLTAVFELNAILQNLGDELEEVRLQKEKKSLADYYLEEIEKAKTQKPLEYGKGFECINKAVGGINPGQLIVIAGRPGSGKSMFALQVADNIKANPENKVLYITLEMSLKETLNRLLKRKGAATSEEVRAMTFTDKKLEGEILPILKNLDCRQSLIIKPYLFSIEGIKAKIREERPKVVIIDQLSLMTIKGSYKDTREKFNEIARELKRTAEKEGVAIILLHQANRKQTEDENYKIIRLEHLAEADGVGQNADVVITINQERENPETRTLYIAKARDGEPGKEFKYMLFGERATFTPLETRL